MKIFVSFSENQCELPMEMMGMELALTTDGGVAQLVFFDSEETVEKTLNGTLEGDTLTLVNPDDDGELEVYFDTDTMNLRLYSDCMRTVLCPALTSPLRKRRRQRHRQRKTRRKVLTSIQTSRSTSRSSNGCRRLLP